MNTPLYIAHVSSKNGADVISTHCENNTHTDGYPVYGEVLACSLALVGNKNDVRCCTVPPIRSDPTTPEYLMNFISSS